MGITLQRVIDQNKAALAYEGALKELMRRIHLQLAQDPENIHILSLAAIQINDLFEDTTQYNATLAAVVRESESIRLTQGKTIRRHLKQAAASVPDLDESLMERRGRAFRERYGQAELAHTSDQHQGSINELMDPFKGSPGLEADKPPQVEEEK